MGRHGLAWGYAGVPAVVLGDVAMAADRLDDPDYPAYTTGRAAEALGVQQAFLRALDAAGAVTPQRSAGGHRRYSRRQLAVAQRIRQLVDQGHSLTSATRILSLEDDLAAERARTTHLTQQLDRRRSGPGHAPTGELHPAQPQSPRAGHNGQG